MSRKVISIFAVLIIAGVLLAACAPAATPAPAADQPNTASAESKPQQPVSTQPAVEPVTIRVMSFFAYDNPEVENEVVAAFENAHPQINVELELVPFADIFTKYKTQTAGGTAPDVISMNFENLRSFATLGALTPLNDLIARDNYDMSIYYENTIDMHTVDGVTFGLPATFSDVVLYYNKTMFDAASQAYPDATWDWAKMVEVGKKFVKDENGDGITDVYGYGLAWWPMYLFLYDTNILTPDNQKCALSSPEGIAAIQALVNAQSVDGITANKEARDFQGDWDRFTSGKLAMYPAGPWAVKPFNDSIKDFEWDIAHHPRGTVQGTFLYSNSYAISASSKNKDAAWEWLKFSTGVEGATIRQRGQFEITSVKSVADSIFIDSMKGQSPATPEIFLEATSYGKRLPDHPRFQEILDAIQPELDLIFIGKKTVAEGLTAACQAVDAIIKE